MSIENYKMNYSVSSEFLKDEENMSAIDFRRPSTQISDDVVIEGQDNYQQLNQNYQSHQASAGDALKNLEGAGNQSGVNSQANEDPNLATRPDLNQPARENFKKILHESLIQMILQGRKEKAFERKYNKFDPVDFLVEQLYNRNPARISENDNSEPTHVALENIPFVKKCLAENPRKIKPLCMRLDDTEAAVIIQKYYRGFQVRKEAEVQELRKWQADYRSVKSLKL